ncbi:hypothetical protein BH09MYX1_BH09MYX1_40470 [soil metagenome]
MSENTKGCGPQTVVVNTEGLRLAKCPCGTFHVTLVASGVTLQLSAERLAELGRAIAVAAPQKSADVCDPLPARASTKGVN